ncbi:hypothetical protein EV421DRAFT_1745773 [Armillaria borealis]|uniref:Uncharacterized protein n=1 Tax=Armillaria borealis TaxID=47425 RepID=A0AA39IE52_9AGAR|nr:hypothetical protein EV421DRAFT_1745773 [Armillaria borealis]
MIAAVAEKLCLSDFSLLVCRFDEWSSIAATKIRKLLATSTRNKPHARHTLESKDQENIQHVFGAIHVLLWWWCEYHGARSTFENPGLAFAFNSGLSTLVPLLFTVSYVSSEQGYSLWEVLVCKHMATTFALLQCFNIWQARAWCFKQCCFYGTWVQWRMHWQTQDGWNGATNILHDILGDNVCAAAIYRHLANVVLSFQLSLLLLGAHKGSISAIDGAGYISLPEVARENVKVIAGLI